MFSENAKVAAVVPLDNGKPDKPIFLNLLINDLLSFASDVSLYSFADDNKLFAFPKTILEFIDILQSQSKIVIDWFKSNKMKIKPDQFPAILLGNRKNGHTNQLIVVDNQNIRVVSSIELFGIQIDDKLNFSLHVSNIFRSAANKLNALIRLKQFLHFKEKGIFINSYFMANFNYYPLVWMFSITSSLKKIENLQKRALRFLYNDFEISYEEFLLKSDRARMNVNRL